MTTVAEMTIKALADFGVAHAWGVVGDALNPLTEAIRQQDRMEWVGVRHEEEGAFAGYRPKCVYAPGVSAASGPAFSGPKRSEEHTSELQPRGHIERRL